MIRRFPAFESLVFGITGVNLPGARFAVALCVAISGALLMLAARTHGSLPIAFGPGLFFLAAPLSRRVAGDVMLEFPAMVFTLLAIRACTRIADGQPGG